MVYKRFTTEVIIRIGLLLVNMICLAYIFARTDLFFTQVLLLLVLIIQVYNLIHFVSQTNRDLAKFILSIKHRDYSVTFQNQPINDPGFGELNQVFSEIIQSYQQAEAQRESQYQYFKRMLEQVNVGIISMKGNDEIFILNKAAQTILQIPEESSWQSLQKLRSSFTKSIEADVSQGSRLIELHIEGEVKQLSLRIDQVVLLGQPFRIIIFQDINYEIEQKEIEAWHKLIRILTHEIMNSVTPVVSLTGTMQMILSQEDGSQKELSAITEENIADIRFSLKTIQKRSGGLLHFLNDYRKLTKVPVPQPETIAVAGLFAEVTTLMQGEINKRQVQLVQEITPPNLLLQADFKLIEQVLINLLTNSLQALESVPQPAIVLSACLEKNKVSIEVSDNGNGIDADKLDKIFIPFYSTKTEGSGIGLSLSKQIMNLHKGTIKVFSQKGIQTKVVLAFPVIG
jgi:two-component system, NtrC family, nitrogen regulation sensor histidine kinase NtrY